eukprot:scaffold9269_cov149-Skeletonema_marinoi.AAC.2
MVTRSVILVTASEAAAFAATSTLSSSASAAAADSVINNVPAEQINLDEELQTNLFNYPSYSKPAQHPSPGGLVQLCRHKGCFHAVDFERRNGGLCCIHQKGPMNGEQSDSNDSEDDGKIRGVTADEYFHDDEVGKKRDCPLEDSISNNKTKKRKRDGAFAIDLSDVPPQSPIPKSSGCVKEGASKYTGVSFDKRMNKWHAQIMIAGKSRNIGYYENEEEAAVDYARAVFKYKGQGHWDRSHDQLRGAAICGNKTKKRQKDGVIAFDLTDVPPQSPVPKCAGTIKDGALKYAGVTFNKRTNKWKAQIHIDGKNRHIGYYENEEEAAVDYARALFKYKGQGALDKARERRALDKEREQNGEICGVTTAVKGLCDRHSTHGNKYGLDNEVGKKRALTSGGSIGGNKTKKCKKVDAFVLDLTGVPPQSPIPKSGGHIKEGASKYKGVHFNKQKNKWQAKLGIEGKNRHIGYYDNEEEAATDYARAVFKYKNQAALGKAREDSFIIDLSDVPPQPPIPKSSGTIKEGASKYTGVHFNKQANKWRVQIDIKGKYISNYWPL